MAHKVVGVGSVGTRAFIVLLQGRDQQDPLFLQVKEATTSVLEDHLPKSRYREAGERVVQGQRLMQAASDIFLGWTKGARGESTPVLAAAAGYEELRDVESMDPPSLAFYGGICGWTLARAHARSGDPVAISGYLGKSDRLRPRRSSTSPGDMRIRTNATTRRSQKRSELAGSPPWRVSRYTLRDVTGPDDTERDARRDTHVATAGEPPEPTPRPKRARRVLHVRIFSSASDAPRSRRPTDAVLLVVSIILVSTFMVPAPDATTTDTAINSFLQQLPGTASGVWQVLYDLLLVWPVVLMLAMLFAHGRKRVFRDMLLALLVTCALIALVAVSMGKDVSALLSAGFSADAHRSTSRRGWRSPPH